VCPHRLKNYEQASGHAVVRALSYSDVDDIREPIRNDEPEAGDTQSTVPQSVVLGTWGHALDSWRIRGTLARILLPWKHFVTKSGLTGRQELQQSLEGDSEAAGELFLGTMGEAVMGLAEILE
jgi:hypothetical protein